MSWGWCSRHTLELISVTPTSPLQLLPTGSIHHCLIDVVPWNFSEFSLGVLDVSGCSEGKKEKKSRSDQLMKCFCILS